MLDASDGNNALRGRSRLSHRRRVSRCRQAADRTRSCRNTVQLRGRRAFSLDRDPAKVAHPQKVDIRPSVFGRILHVLLYALYGRVFAQEQRVCGMRGAHVHSGDGARFRGSDRYS